MKNRQKSATNASRSATDRLSPAQAATAGRVAPAVDSRSGNSWVHGCVRLWIARVSPPPAPALGADVRAGDGLSPRARGRRSGAGTIAVAATIDAGGGNDQSARTMAARLMDRPYPSASGE